MPVVQPDDQLMRSRAETGASCQRAGRGLGHKIHEADRWIAATAIRLAVDIGSDDNLFRNLPDLGRKCYRRHLIKAGICCTFGVTGAPWRLSKC
jgi:predicted nucleic acid-binding protein